MAEESKPKPAWSQSYFFPEEKFSFMGWGSEKQHLNPATFSEPKTTGSAVTLVKPLGTTGSISPHFILQPWRRLGPLGICQKLRDVIPSQAKGLPHLRQSQKSS